MDPYGFPLQLQIVTNKKGEEAIAPVENNKNNPSYSAHLNPHHEDYWKYLKDVDPYSYNELKHIKEKQNRPMRKVKSLQPKRGKPTRLKFISQARNAKITSNNRGEIVKKFDKAKYGKGMYKDEKAAALLVNSQLENHEEVSKNLRRRTQAVHSYAKTTCLHKSLKQRTSHSTFKI